MRVFIFFLAFLHFQANATISVPGNLNQAEREQALRLLGLGTSTKILSTPYPLGGYSGFEFGIGMEFIDVTDLGSMGSGITSKQEMINYPRLNFGKGFYNNLDLFFHFTPYNDVSGISEYGGLLRWGVFQSAYLPTSISLLMHANATNVAEKIYTTTVGADIIAGFSLKYLSLYFGGGQTDSAGVFLGNSSLASSNNERVSNIHTIMGGTLTVQQFFLAAQLDRYNESVFSIKLGYRN